MDSSNKRQKLPCGDEEANAPYQSIWKLVMPFIPMDDLFSNPFLCLVNKESHHECLKLLDDHCQEHHPTLLLMGQVHSNRTSESGDRWLTYPRYRMFRDPQPEHQPEAAIIDLADYEMILDISTLEGVLLAHDIQKLNPNRFNCTFGIDNFPCSGKDMRAGDVTSLGLKVRVLMRQISTGKLAVVLYQKGCTNLCMHNRNRDVFTLYYTSKDLSQDHVIELNAHVTFSRHRTSTGEIILGNGRVGEPVEIEFSFTNEDEDRNGNHVMTMLQNGVDHWTWV